VTPIESRQLGRPSYAELAAYRPDPDPCAIDLSDNTNLWGAPPSAERAMRGANLSLARYPEAYSETLKRRLAEYVGVPDDQIIVGCGSDDVLDSAIRAFGEPGTAVAMADPTFVMVPVLARTNGLDVIRVPVLADGRTDIDRLSTANAAITYVCSPNNPTGRVATLEEIERVIVAAPGVVIVDEAYMEFAGQTATSLLSKYERLLVARTMSKAFGLASLRVGYAIAAPGLIKEVEKARGPFKVSAHASIAAEAALRHDQEWVRARVAETIDSRERFLAALRELGLSPLPSAANFVLVPVRDAACLDRKLRRSSVAVRPFKNLATLGDALRITIGPWSMMEVTLAALREALTECA
jgi:histidinol-phosphate aminotransferase